MINYSFELEKLIEISINFESSLLRNSTIYLFCYLQTFGNKKEDEKDDFFKGATLASYIVLNDNLRYHEEQYRKQISFEFSLSGKWCLFP